MISLNSVKKTILEAKFPKNNIRAIEYEITIINKDNPRQWFWKELNKFTFKAYLLPK